MKIELRPVAENDFANVVEMQSRSFAQLARSHHTPEQMLANEKVFRDPTYLSDLHKCNLTLALIGDEIVGSAGWCEHEPNVARVRKVFVSAKYSRRGIGRLLVDHVEEQIQSAGFKDTILRASMNAIPFYEKIGFVSVRQEARVLSAGVDEPAMLMRRSNPSRDSVTFSKQWLPVAPI